MEGAKINTSRYNQERYILLKSAVANTVGGYNDKSQPIISKDFPAKTSIKIYDLTANTANLPISSSHPKQILYLRPSILCSINRSSTNDIEINSSTPLPHRSSQALSDHSSLPGAMEPVSSIRVPITLGFSDRVSRVEQCLHVEVVVFV